MHVLHSDQGTYRSVCVTVPGTGKGLHWTVSASSTQGVWSSPLSVSTTRYTRPFIHDFSVNSNPNPNQAIYTRLTTYGFDKIEVNATGVGPSQPKLWSTYDASFTARAVAPDSVNLVWGPWRIRSSIDLRDA